MKKIIFILTTASLLIGIALFGMTASATFYGDLDYYVSDGEVTITGCFISATSVIIPETIDGYPVTRN